MPIMLGNYNGQNVIPLLVDSSGRALVSIDAVTGTYLPVDVHSMPITEVKSINNNRIHSIESILKVRTSNTNLAGGNGVVSSSAVPAGKVWVITTMAYAYVGTITNVELQISINGSSTNYVLTVNNPIVSGQWYFLPHLYYVDAGEVILLTCYNSTAGDDAYLDIRGYVMGLS